MPTTEARTSFTYSGVARCFYNTTPTHAHTHAYSAHARSENNTSTARTKKLPHRTARSRLTMHIYYILSTVYCVCKCNCRAYRSISGGGGGGERMSTGQFVWKPCSDRAAPRIYPAVTVWMYICTFLCKRAHLYAKSREHVSTRLPVCASVCANVSPVRSNSGRLSS